MGSIFIIIQSMIYDIVSNIDEEKLFPYKNKSNRFSGKMQEWDLHQDRSWIVTGRD